MLAVPAWSLSSCRAYCFAMPGPHVSGNVAQIRASCEAISVVLLDKRRSIEAMARLRKERRNGPLFSELLSPKQSKNEKRNSVQSFP